MKRSLVSALSVVVALAVAARTPAAEQKPLVVVTFPSFDALMEDVKYVGTLSGTPELADMAKAAIFFTAGGLNGLDKANPIGMAVTTDGEATYFVGFVPVESLDKLLESIKPLMPVEPEDAGDGVKKIDAGFQTIYIKEKGKWAYISTDTGALDAAPDDPLSHIGELSKSYDIGARAYVQNLPQEWIDFAMGAIEQGLDQGLVQMEGESDEAFEKRQEMAEAQLDMIKEMVGDLDQFTIGLSLDSAEKKAYLDFSITAKSGSKTAEEFAASYEDLTTAFGAFKKAAISMNVVSRVPKEDAEAANAQLEAAKAQVLEQIENEGSFPNDEVKDTVKGIVEGLMDALVATINEGTFDAGAGLMGEGPFSVALGMRVADGPALVPHVKDAVKLGQDAGAISDAQFDAATHGDVTFHVFSLNIPDGEAEGLDQFFGKDPKIVVGVAPKAVYFCFGREGIETLKGVIDDSKAVADEKTLPFELSASLKPLLAFAADQNPDQPQLAAAVEALGDSGDDHVRIISKPISNGAALRIEAEEGVLKMMGALVSALRREFAPF